MIAETLIGVATGLVGNIFTSITNYKLQKLNNEHEIAKIKAESEAMKAEAEANVKITRAQVEGEIELADSKAYEISQQKGHQALFSTRFMEKLYESPWTAWIGSILAFLFGLIDTLKAAMRPGLTAYLVALTSWITFVSMDILQKHGQVLTADQAGAIFDQVTSIVIYLTVSCVTWWFGDRRVAKFLMRLKDGNLKNQTG